MSMNVRKFRSRQLRDVPSKCHWAAFSLPGSAKFSIESMHIYIQIWIIAVANQVIFSGNIIIECKALYARLHPKGECGIYDYVRLGRKACIARFLDTRQGIWTNRIGQENRILLMDRAKSDWWSADRHAELVSRYIFAQALTLQRIWHVSEWYE